MIIKELRKLTIEELKDKIAESKKELRELEFNLKIGKENDYSSRKILRRDIARLLSVYNEKKSEENNKLKV